MHAHILTFCFRAPDRFVRLPLPENICKTVERMLASRVGYSHGVKVHFIIGQQIGCTVIHSLMHVYPMFTEQMPLQISLKVGLVIADSAAEVWWFAASHSLMQSQTGGPREWSTAPLARMHHVT